MAWSGFPASSDGSGPATALRDLVEGRLRALLDGRRFVVPRRLGQDRPGRLRGLGKAVGFEEVLCFRQGLRVLRGHGGTGRRGSGGGGDGNRGERNGQRRRWLWL